MFKVFFFLPLLWMRQQEPAAPQQRPTTESAALVRELVTANRLNEGDIVYCLTVLRPYDARLTAAPDSAEAIRQQRAERMQRLLYDKHAWQYVDAQP